MSRQEKTPLETAVGILMKQALSRQLLRRKLHDKGFSWKAAEEAVSDCERYGYINDRLVAETKVSIMRDRGDGARKIRLNLRLKGFEKEVIDEAFKSDEKMSERDELSIALDVLRRKKISLDRESDPVKKKLKALRTLASKGFSSGVSYQALNRFFGDPENSFDEESCQ